MVYLCRIIQQYYIIFWTLTRYRAYYRYFAQRADNRL